MPRRRIPKREFNGTPLEEAQLQLQRTEAQMIALHAAINAVEEEIKASRKAIELAQNWDLEMKMDLIKWMAAGTQEVDTRWLYEEMAKRSGELPPELRKRLIEMARPPGELSDAARRWHEALTPATLPGEERGEPSEDDQDPM